MFSENKIWQEKELSTSAEKKCAHQEMLPKETAGVLLREAQE